MYGLIKKNEST